MTLIFTILALAILTVVLLAMRQPNTFTVTRKRRFNATPDAIFTQLISFRNWQNWSPWEGRDPQMQREYSGAESGVGAYYAWLGNKNVGQGNMTITHVTLNKNIKINLNFEKPFKAENTTDFTLNVVDATHTELVWSMSGCNNFMSKIMQVFMNMDKMIGKDFEQGLENLQKTVQ